MAKPQITSVENEGNKSLVDILEEMNGLWQKARKEWRERKLDESHHKELDDIYDRYRPDHPQLYSSYPTVVKHALMEMNYHPNAFKLYLKRLKVRPWMSDEQRLESYADYAVLLYKELNPRRWQPNQMAAFRADYITRLTTEHKKFESTYKKHAADIAKEETRYESERRMDLIRALEEVRKLREQSSNHGSVSERLSEGTSESLDETGAGSANTST